MRYLRPKSLTWWSSVASLTIGLTSLLCETCKLWEVSELIAMLNGSYDSSPASLIILGLIGIGLNDKFERMRGSL